MVAVVYNLAVAAGAGLSDNLAIAVWAGLSDNLASFAGAGLRDVRFGIGDIDFDSLLHLERSLVFLLLSLVAQFSTDGRICSFRRDTLSPRRFDDTEVGGDKCTFSYMSTFHLKANSYSEADACIHRYRRFYTCPTYKLGKRGPHCQLG